MQKFLDPFNKINWPLNQIVKYLIATILIIVPLYPKFPFIHIPGTYVSIRFEDFLLAITALFIFVKVIPNIKKILEDNIVRAVIVFLLIGLVSLLSGIFLTQTVTANIGVLHFLRRVEYFIPFFAFLAFSFPKKNLPTQPGKNLSFYIKVLMITVFVAFLYGVGQRYFYLPVIMTQNSESSKGMALRWTPGSQATSTFAGHYDLAAFMVLVLPILISLIFVVKDTKFKILLAIVSLSGYWLLVNTASRISLASYLFAVCVSLILLKKFKAIFFVVIISLILTSFSPSLFARYKNLIDVYSQKIKNVKLINLNPYNFKVSAQEVTIPARTAIPLPTAKPKPVIEDRSTSIRLNVEWPRAIRAFSKNPLLGTGYSSIGLASDNDYLRLLAEVGLLGFLSFILILVRIFLTLTSAFPLTEKLNSIRLGFVAGIIGGVSGTLVNAVFIDVFEASKFAIIFWLLLGCAVSIVRNNNYEE
jgi:hypothetical protein